MKLKLLSIKLIIIISVVFALLYSCANVGSITGGPKDTLAPVMLLSKPKMKDVNFKGKKVIIRFNEYFELKDINQEFVSSPPFKEMPKFTVKQKSLHIKFQEELQRNVTYNLKFGNAIADFNEGNINKDFQYIFATKDTIDPYAVSGNLKDAYNLEVPENTFVALYKEDFDSIPYFSMPYYMAKLDTLGNFNIDYVEKGRYKIFAFTDMNSNKIADEFEPRAFLDSLITTQIEEKVQIDSLKAGTILHDKINSELTDSLTQDTVIVQNITITKPDNLQMYLFQEAKFVQKLLDYSRKTPSKVNMFFDMPLDSAFKIEALNFDLPFENMLLERSINNDTVTWWIKDSTIIKQDSLETIVSYSKIDSLGNLVTQKDTLLFEFRKKKKREFRRKKSQNEPEKKPKVYISPKYLISDNKVDLKSKFSFELPTPIRKIDTSKIKLFEVFDTMTVDTKKQKILKNMRLNANELYFKFQRPIAKQFSLKLLNFNKDNWYSQTALDSNRVYKLTITDPEVAKTDTLKLVAKYDNNFFFNQIQELEDSLEMPLSEYKITSRNRNTPDEITLTFDRPVKGNVIVKLDEVEMKTKWYEVEKNISKDSITIKITDDKISYNDTLTFMVRFFQYLDLKNDSSFFEQTMRIIYKEPEQYISSYKRMSKDSVQVVFNTKLQSDPTVQVLGMGQMGNWYKLTKNNTEDTLMYKITNQAIADIDSLKLQFAYSHKSRKNIVSNMKDTVVFAVSKPAKQKRRNSKYDQDNKDKNKTKVSVNLPIAYNMYQDSVKMRNYSIKYDWKEDTKYVLQMDSMAFEDIYGIYNKNLKYDFATRKNTYYTALVLNLQDIHAEKRISVSKIPDDDISKDLENTTIPRQMQQNIVGQGNIIVHLLNKNNNVSREFLINKDQEIIMDFLHPGEYTIRIIYDKNNNGEWDTGNYFMNMQPERVITNGKAFMLKTNFENKFTWDVGKTLVESCYAKYQK